MNVQQNEEELRRAIGRRIAEARERVGLSQEDLADKVGVRSATISRYERGAFQPRLDKLAPLADALGTSADWLFRGVSNTTRVAKTDLPPVYAEFYAGLGASTSDPERAILEDAALRDSFSRAGKAITVGVLAWMLGAIKASPDAPPSPEQLRADVEIAESEPPRRPRRIAPERRPVDK